MNQASTAVAQTPRARAASLITRWLRTGDFPDRMLRPDEADRAFLMEVVYGIARRRRTLEWVVNRYVESRPSPDVMAHLFVGLYQLLFMDTVTDYAAVNETVEAVKGARLNHSVGFVNGVLRRVTRERDEIRRMLAIESISVRESHPDILVNRWTRQFGMARTLAFCRWNNSRPSPVIAPRPAQEGIRQYLTELRHAGIVDAYAHPADKARCIEVPRGVRIEDLPGYDDGRFTIQDPAALVAVDLLDAQPDEQVLDACAAPGGKAILIADRMQGRGMLVAMDLHPDRCKRLQANILRTHLDNVLVVEGDATDPHVASGFREGRFDRILLDVPCTNTGVLRRRPDARWRFTEKRLTRLQQQQRRMLDNLAGLVKRGGTIVYSTCSVEPEEGARLVQDWVRDRADFALDETCLSLPPASRMEGGFAARLVRQ